jgi:membrane-bound metal-dependent hydrolase YbcI (DUF457 family)
VPDVPVTLAHPIAAIPLRRPLGRFGVLSALVIGSVMPDVPLFLPLSLHRNVTHSLAGLLYFCLPVGALAYLLFDRVLERPLRALMPEAIQRRLPPASGPRRPPVWSIAAIVSILAGAATHAVWDSFTHGGAAAVRLFPVLETRLFTVSGYTAYVFSVLQHTSSIVGTIVMAMWLVRWYRTAPRRSLASAPDLTPRARRWLLLSIAVVVVAAAAGGGASRFPEEPTLRALQPFARRIIVAGLSSLSGTLMLYGVAWHWMHARGARET